MSWEWRSRFMGLWEEFGICSLPWAELQENPPPSDVSVIRSGIFPRCNIALSSFRSLCASS